MPRKNRRNWNKEETSLFLQCYKAHKHEFNNSRKKVIAFNRVLKDMIAKGFDSNGVDEETLRGKLKTLLQGYQQKKKKKENSHIAKAPFEDMLLDIFEGKPPEVKFVNKNAINNDTILNQESQISSFPIYEASTATTSSSFAFEEEQDSDLNELLNMLPNTLHAQPTSIASPTNSFETISQITQQIFNITEDKLSEISDEASESTVHVKQKQRDSDLDGKLINITSNASYDHTKATVFPKNNFNRVLSEKQNLLNNVDDELDSTSDDDDASESTVHVPKQRKIFFEEYLKEKLNLQKKVADQKIKAIETLMKNNQERWLIHHKMELERLEVLKDIRAKLI